MSERHSLSGFLLGAGGIATICAMDVVAKNLGASLPTLQIVFVRYAGAALWLALYLVLTRRAWPQRANLKRHALRGVLMAITAFFFFYGITHLPLAIAAALAMSAPIYVSFLGIVFLKEPASPTLVLGIALGVVGSLIVIFGGEPIIATGASSLAAWGAAILAPVCYAGALVLLKHHSSDEGAAAMILAQSAIAAIAALPFAVSTMIVPPVDTLWQISLIGFLGAVGFIFVVAGLRRLPASIFASIDYTGLLWAALFGYVFFGETVGLRFWLGGGLIILACTISMRTKPKAAPTPLG
ncbi:DMT family transporter [Mariluticola halotolerans]|uniref:DMT family transporter n=1 Tax=Mariluticola halotolerans TaxID=2909283 RepID=UPI0026E2BEB7|nr:DMT family transporter [Mariluticola halotolerans]UJQ96142.1 DMT family transporter [Mariluticola halotolerans]